MKQLFTLILFIMLAGLMVACGQTSNDVTPEATAESTQAPEESTVRGTVVEVVQGIAYDGNNELILTTDEGQISVLVMESGFVAPEMQDQVCNKNQAANDVLMSLNVGDVVEVFGVMNEDGILAVCADARYSITLIEAAPESTQSPEEVTIRGTVVENIQGVAFDGNNELILATDEGQITVLVMEGGLVTPDMAALQCNQNQAANEATWELKAGDVVEVFGTMNEDGVLAVCADERYSITLIEAAEGTEAAQDNHTVIGTVLENNHSCEVDATCYLLVDTPEGQWTVVYGTGERLPIEGQALCNVTSDATQAAWDIEVGATIEAFGRVRGENEIGLCYEGDYTLIVNN